MSDIGSAIGDAIIGAIIFFAVIAFLAGALAVWGLPKLWVWIKPFIHAVTAG